MLREKVKRKIESGNHETTISNFKEALVNYKEALELNQGLLDDTETLFQINVNCNDHKLNISG